MREKRTKFNKYSTIFVGEFIPHSEEKDIVSDAKIDEIFGKSKRLQTEPPMMDIKQLQDNQEKIDFAVTKLQYEKDRIARISQTVNNEELNIVDDHLHEVITILKTLNDNR